MMMTSRKTIEEIIAGHEARNRSLRLTFVEKKVDLEASRRIECHFWVWGRNEAAELVQALKRRGFDTKTGPAQIDRDANRWNLEAAIKQSIDLTLRPEFTEEMAHLAASYGGIYDGWGTIV